MKSNYSGISRLVYVFVIASLIMFSSNALAQLDELEELDALGVEETPCQPEDLTTIYDQFKSDSLGQQQVGIWYSLAREEFKYNNYKRAIPYYWKVLVNDQTDKFKIVFTKLTQCYYNLNQPDSVLIVCYRGLEKYPDQVLLLVKNH